MELLDNGMCFACGPKNPIGLKLAFVEEDGKYVTRFTPGVEHQGFAGITHGGVISTVLDEAMARFAYVKGYQAVTAEMTIRLLRPARVGDELTVMGWIQSEKRRVLECAAEARDSRGELVAEAIGKMVRV